MFFFQIQQRVHTRSIKGTPGLLKGLSEQYILLRDLNRKMQQTAAHDKTSTTSTNEMGKDTWVLVAHFLTVKDVLNLELTCRVTRRAVAHYFQEIAAKRWPRLLEKAGTEGLSIKMLYLEQLRAYEAWVLVSICPFLRKKGSLSHSLL